MNQKNTGTPLEADNPLDLPEEDCLSRAVFCEALADTLANRQGDESLAVGVTGNWGTGKSTIKNFVKHFLRQRSARPIVIEFNPWEWSGQGKLLEAFLNSLSEALGKKNVLGRYNKLGKRLKRYSAALQVGGEITSVLSKVIAGTGVGAISVGLWAYLDGHLFSGFSGLIVPALVVVASIPTLFEKLTGLIDAHSNFSKKTVEDLREEIAKDLAAIKSPIVVFVDDVDRL